MLFQITIPNAKIGIKTPLHAVTKLETTQLVHITFVLTKETILPEKLHIILSDKKNTILEEELIIVKNQEKISVNYIFNGLDRFCFIEAISEDELDYFKTFCPIVCTALKIEKVKE